MPTLNPKHGASRTPVLNALFAGASTVVFLALMGAVVQAVFIYMR